MGIRRSREHGLILKMTDESPVLLRLIINTRDPSVTKAILEAYIVCQTSSPERTSLGQRQSELPKIDSGGDPCLTPYAPQQERRWPKLNKRL